MLVRISCLRLWKGRVDKKADIDCRSLTRHKLELWNLPEYGCKDKTDYPVVPDENVDAIVHSL